MSIPQAVNSLGCLLFTAERTSDIGVVMLILLDNQVDRRRSHTMYSQLLDISSKWITCHFCESRQTVSKLQQQNVVHGQDGQISGQVDTSATR